MDRWYFKYILLFSFGVLLLSACAPRVTIPGKRTVGTEGPAEADRIASEIEQDESRRNEIFSSAESAFSRGEMDRARELFSAFAENYPEDDRADDALFRLGDIYMKKSDLDSAVSSFQRIVTDYVGYDLFLEAKHKLAIAYFRRGDYNDAIQILKGLLDTTLEKGKRTVVIATIADSYLNIGNNFDAVSWYMKAVEEVQKKENEKKIRERILKIIEKRMSPEDLEEVSNVFQGTFASYYATYALIKVMVDEGRYEEAMLEAQELIKRDIDEEIKVRAEDILDIIVQRMAVKADTIGCILPLSGKFAPYGRKVLKGIQLAAGIFGDTEGAPVNLVVEDSKGDPAEVVRAVERLVEKERVVAIIGPLLSSVAEMAAFEAQERGVPMVVLSQKMGIPEIGDYIFRNFLTSRLQTRMLARYAVQDLGIKRFAILYPEDYYGEEFMNLFWNDISLLGGDVVGIEVYDKEQYDFGREIKRLVGMDKVNKKDEEEKPEIERLRPIVDFEAVFIPDSYDKAALIAPHLAYNDIKNVKLLGTNSWNSRKLIDMGGKYIEGAVFVDGFHYGSRYKGAQSFASGFESVYGHKPGVLEAQSYDATKMVATLIRNGEGKSRVELRDALLSLRNLEGATGWTNVTKSGDVDKDLFVLTVSKGEIVEAERSYILQSEGEIEEEDRPLME